MGIEIPYKLKEKLGPEESEELIVVLKQQELKFKDELNSSSDKAIERNNEKIDALKQEVKYLKGEFKELKDEFKELRKEANSKFNHIYIMGWTILALTVGVLGIQIAMMFKLIGVA